jgi:ribosomal protein S18 acetylase RimI-like enzyme
MAATAIEWSDEVWNPVRGCTKVSPGCAHCYAETFAERFRGTPGHTYEQGFDLRLVPEKLTEPLKWKKPRRVFVNSMSDLFHESVPDDFISDVFATMGACHDRGLGHVFQILTKRPYRERSSYPGVSEMNTQQQATIRTRPLVVLHDLSRVLAIDEDCNQWEAWTEEQWRSICKGKQYGAVVALVRHWIAGVLVCQYHKGKVYVAKIIVAPAWQRQGIGSYLVAKLLFEADERAVWAAVPEDNLPAQLFFRSMGFRCRFTEGREEGSVYLMRSKP